MEHGRIHAVLIATRRNHVLYERFYDSFSETQKGELRAAMQQASRPTLAYLKEHQAEVSFYRDAVISFMPVADVVFYVVGSGEYNEMTCQTILRLLHNALATTMKKKVGEAALLEKYTKMCITVDEVINEGMLDCTDLALIHQATKLKGSKTK